MTTPGSPLRLIGSGYFQGSSATSRTFTVTQASPAGQTRLCLIGINGSLQTTTLTDSAGGTWVKDSEWTGGPSGAVYRCAGDGSPALPANSTLTINYPTSTAAFNYAIFDGDLGALDVVISGTGQSPTITPAAANSTLIMLLNGNPATAPSPEFTAPMTLGWSAFFLQSLTMGYGVGGPGQLTLTVNHGIAATYRVTAYSFRPRQTGVPLAITSTLPAARQGQPYSAALTAEGGTPPYAWTASGLPAGLSLNSAAAQITGTPSATGTYPVQLTVSDAALAISQMFEVNYFPATPGGYGMWASYSGARVRADFARIRSLGFNAIRCIIPARSDSMAFPTPTAPQLANLQDFYQAAQAAGLYLHPTLFDMSSTTATDNIPGSITHMNALIAALKAVDPALAMIYLWEPKNELFSLYTAAETYWPTHLAFSNAVTAEFRRLTPGIPVCVSVAGGMNMPGGGLEFLYQNTFGTVNQPDWYDYHCYQGPALSQYTNAISNAIARVGGNPRILRVGEGGYNVEGSVITGQQLSDQARGAQNIRNAAATLGLPQEPSWWILYDIAPNSGYQFPTGQMSGLFDAQAVIKPSGQTYQAYPPGTTPPAI